ncbi:TMP repeat family protein [Streptococcus oralis]|uniref:tail length tape measure protein n=1 Tax=Streptococcus phage SM1 TaxID=157924 RepID=UPI000009B88D|nr:PblA [Streptococcus oralis]NP_862888.1 tail length tape measure protein [Streptococcus phage SM1]AAG18638.1 PblA [Streptococcus phage SM1]QQL00445.1 PblA [Streptococcus oralis]QRO08223.1 TMP repeat family protein [Streptococcus oralis]
MATEIAQAYVQLIPSARGITGKIQSILNPEASAAGQSAGQSLGSSLVGVMTKVIAAAGIGKAFSAAISEGAALQQSLGGIETLFKGSADKVKGYANEAYKTTGLSANAYMENVTGFSASLLQSLGGDTNKAAETANMAMIDMSDNANKMGTSMESIQMAYQGFAKQNYTMLDNLKLGYGGTKQEMQRLLADAEKLTGVKYDINNLSDVYSAIHAIQENLDITGTTAKEAASTFSGSFESMKAAAQNVLGKLALGENILPSLHALLKTTSTFLFDNFLPMIGNVFSGLGLVLTEGISQIASQLFGDAFGSAVFDQLSRITGIFETFFDMIFGSLSKQDNIDILNTIGFSEEAATQIVNIADNIRVTFENIGSAIGDVVGIVGDFVGDLLGIKDGEQGVNLLGTAFETVTNFIRKASEHLSKFTKWLKNSPIALDVLKSAVVGITSAWAGYKAVMTVIKGIEAIRNATLSITNGLMLAQFVRTGALTTAEAANAAATMGASGAFGIFNAVLAANPIGLIVTAVAALTAGLVWFFTQTETGQKIWSSFVDWIKQAWQGIADFFVGIWSGISEGASTLWDGVVTTWNAYVESLKAMWNAVVTFFSDLWESIKEAASTAWTLITTAVMMVVQPFIDGFMNIWNNISEGLTQVWEGIKLIFEGAWEFIKSIFLGAILIIIDLVTGNFGQLGADLSLIWEGIKNGISLIWEGIKTYFSGVVDVIVGYATGVFENFSNVLSTIWEFIKTAASMAWEWIKSTVSNLITGLIQGAQNLWNNFVSFLSGLWENIKSTASAAWSGLKSLVLGFINGLVSGAQTAWNNMKQAVSDLVTKVTNIFNGIKNINLWEAGKAILNGFLGGLKSAWEGVTNFVGGIANWIRDHKGPIEYDRKLLIPAGNAIMGSLDNGLKDGFKDVKKTVGGMSGEISDVFSGDNLDLNSTASVTKNLEARLAMPSAQLEVQESKTVSEIAIMRSSLESILTAILEKSSDIYLDNEKISLNTYEQHGSILAREGI